MALHLAIDGYNLLGASTGRGLGVRDIEKERENLIERLNAYRRVKGCKVTVVFDARGSGRLTRTRGKRNGIEVIFSGADEDADLILKEMAREKGASLTIVTSDREVRGHAESQGTVVITSGAFSKLLDMALNMDIKGLEEDRPGSGFTDMDYKPAVTGRGRAARKKGPSKRAPKSKRKRQRRLKKL
jgi:predicted RNA-binding protein with PIN domain